MTNQIKDSSADGRTALVTGGSAGLGRALVEALLVDGWHVVTDARSLEHRRTGRLVEIRGDVTDQWHRAALAAEVADLGRLDLLVHNASTLGPVPLRPLAEATASGLETVWRTNVTAPLLLTADLLPALRASGGTVLSLSSDAAVEHYPTWGPYGASKAALDHAMLTLAAEEPAITAYAVDPGDMRTAMHQAAFPGEDISDRPLPAAVVPQLLALLGSGLPSGRVRATDLRTAA